MTQWPSVALPPRLPLVVTTSNRNSSTAKDAKLVNCYTETDADTGDIWIIKRPGLASAGVIADGQPGFGTYYWQGHTYSIFNDTLYRDGVSVGTGLDNLGGVYHFSSILGSTPKMVFNNGRQGYAYDDIGGVTANLHSIDSDYPATTVKGWAYLNGPEYVMDLKSVIWGSAINSVSVPGDWDPLNFIRAQIEPDNGICMAKQLVYAIAMKEWSTEIFFDAGNAVGSPLGPVEGSKVSFGCASADSVQSIDDILFWITTNRTASVQVGMMQQLSFRIISTKYIDKLLAEADLSTVFSWQLKLDGHNFYVITIKNANLTLAFDISENRWHQWTDANGNYFPIVSSTYDAQGRHILQHETNGRLYYASSDYFKDLTDPINVELVTPIFDGNTHRYKANMMMKFIADQQIGSTLLVSKSDDDYQTWSNPRKVNLGSKDPRLSNNGSFVKRAYKFQHSQDCAMRLKAIEIQYDLGTL